MIAASCLPFLFWFFFFGAQLNVCVCINVWWVCWFFFLCVWFRVWVLFCFFLCDVFVFTFASVWWVFRVCMICWCVRFFSFLRVFSVWCRSDFWFVSFPCVCFCVCVWCVCFFILYVCVGVFCVCAWCVCCFFLVYGVSAWGLLVFCFFVSMCMMGFSVCIRCVCCFFLFWRHQNPLVRRNLPHVWLFFFLQVVKRENKVRQNKKTQKKRNKLLTMPTIDQCIIVFFWI